ncbi:GT-D fold domain-containing glycosyltransferase [Salinisphaera hydrothermalis]|uniref:GT-D fold domain-containing glycosyltransferase n=1 Tax=Salinisphaera hydrothermalis TaxID=563188 RepID=UPI003340BB44
MSIIRFGDGELEVMCGRGIGYQAASETLSSDLVEISQSQDERVLLCLPPVFTKIGLLNQTARAFWQESLARNRKNWLHYFGVERRFGNAFLSRPYADFKDDLFSAEAFSYFRKIISGKKILVVEGEFTFFGAGNDLLAGAASVERVLAPATNAYAQVHSIVSYVRNHNRADVVLVALGPAAKKIVYELARCNIQTIDIGHLDIEYEWYIRGSRRKVSIPGKWVNEADIAFIAGENDDIVSCRDAQTVKRIL